MKEFGAPIAEAEVRRWFDLRHANLVKLLGVTDNGSHLVTELIPGGTVADWFKSGRRRDPFRCLCAVHDAALALEWVHASGSVHGDLKPENLLVDKQGHVKVLLSLNRAAKIQSTCTNANGTLPFWRAPEDLTRGDADGAWLVQAPADVYALGMIFWELASGRKLQEKLKSRRQWREFVACCCDRKGRPPLKDVDAVYHPLLSAMWHADPAMRPTMAEVRQRLAHLLIDVTIGETTGARDFWRQPALLGQHTVQWPTFRHLFTEYLTELERSKTKSSISPPSSFSSSDLTEEEEKHAVDYFRLLLIPDDAASGSVSCDAFGHVVATLGPVDGKGFLQRLLLLCRQPWFHGDISAEKAVRLLSCESEPSYAFLVRLSSEPGFLTISQRLPTTSGAPDVVRHFRIKHCGDTTVSFDGRTYASVQGLVTARIEEVTRQSPELQLLPCSEASCFQRLHPKRALPEYVEALLDPDLCPRVSSHH